MRDQSEFWQPLLIGMPRFPRTRSDIDRSFRLARTRYAHLGVDVDRVLRRLRGIPLSLPCWQGDDVGGFEHPGAAVGGGLAVTGGFPGKARTPDELRSDLQKALSLIPGRHRVSLHASYGEFKRRKTDRDEIHPEHFRGWIEWAREHQLGLDFNPTFFAHPRAASGFTLSHRDPAIRAFWIRHGIRAREIGAAMGKALGKPCITNFWIPDGFKDTPADRSAPRERLEQSLDAIFEKKISARLNIDALEPKLFGLGSESYVTGSYDFYLGYAVSQKKWLCLDAGHFHPTESVADKISSVLQFVPGILLHLSRGVRWDSDHVVTLTEELQAIAREVVANDADGRVRIGMDYFDASINRVAAWVIGARNVLKALLTALLEPSGIRAAERMGDFTARLALQEEAKTLPLGAVWDYYCESHGVPAGERWLTEVQLYKKDVLHARD